MFDSLSQYWKPRIVIPLVFLLILFTGIFASNDYGVTADESAVGQYAYETIMYLFFDGPVPLQRDWLFFGPLWPTVMEGLTTLSFNVFGLSDSTSVWIIRHLLTFLLYFGSLIAFYFLGKRLTSNWKYALLGVLFLFLSPRIFAHSFTNPKDLPGMALFTISMLTLLISLDKRSWWMLLIHATVCSILISTRIFGLLIPALTVAVFLVQGRNVKAVLQSVLFIIFLLLSLYIIWPALWEAPVEGLITAFTDNSSRGGGGFYFGQLQNTWHYLPVWITISTPLLYTALFLVGFGVLLSKLIRRSISVDQSLLLCWLILPLLAIFGLGAGIFDEWRHVMFLYPAFILIGIIGLSWLYRKLPHGSIHMVINLLVAFFIISSGYWIMKWHPYQYAYFSVPNSIVDGQFELDYWGASYRQGFEWIVQNDKRANINVFVTANAAKAAVGTLPERQRLRLHFTNADDAHYILDNFRPDQYQKKYEDREKVHSIVVDGLEILGLYKNP